MFQESRHKEFTRSHVPVGAYDPWAAQPLGGELEVVENRLVHRASPVFTMLAVGTDVVQAAVEDTPDPAHTDAVLHVRRNENLSKVLEIPAAAAGHRAPRTRGVLLGVKRGRKTSFPP